METKEIILQGKAYLLTVERKKMKNMYLRIKLPDELAVTAPLSMPMESIEAFVYGKEKWILKAFEKGSHRQKTRDSFMGNQGSIVFLGKRRNLHVVESSHPGMIVEETDITLRLPELTKECFEKTFEKQAAKYLGALCEKLRQRYDVMLDDYHLSHPELHFRKMTSKWGSCIPAKVKITLNINLIYYPVECLDYVLLHEMVHMIVPNHSERFYRIIEMRMPDYRKIQKILREN